MTWMKGWFFKFDFELGLSRFCLQGLLITCFWKCFRFCCSDCNCSFWRYQLDLCKKALEENVIVYLGTGCGKTRIAVMLIYEMRHLIRKPQKSVCVFLAPTVALVQQVICSSILWNLAICFCNFWLSLSLSWTLALPSVGPNGSELNSGFCAGRHTLSLYIRNQRVVSNAICKWA